MLARAAVAPRDGEARGCGCGSVRASVGAGAHLESQMLQEVGRTAGLRRLVPRTRVDEHAHRGSIAIAALRTRRSDTSPSQPAVHDSTTRPPAKSPAHLAGHSHAVAQRGHLRGGCLQQVGRELVVRAQGRSGGGEGAGADGSCDLHMRMGARWRSLGRRVDVAACDGDAVRWATRARHPLASWRRSNAGRHPWPGAGDGFEQAAVRIPSGGLAGSCAVARHRSRGAGLICASCQP